MNESRRYEVIAVNLIKDIDQLITKVDCLEVARTMRDTCRANQAGDYEVDIFDCQLGDFIE